MEPQATSWFNTALYIWYMHICDTFFRSVFVASAIFLFPFVLFDIFFLLFSLNVYIWMTIKWMFIINKRIRVCVCVCSCEEDCFMWAHQRKKMYTFIHRIGEWNRSRFSFLMLYMYMYGLVWEDEWSSHNHRHHHEKGKLLLREFSNDANRREKMWRTGKIDITINSLSPSPFFFLSPSLSFPRPWII